MMIPMYNTETFQNVFPNVEEFIDEYQSTAFAKNVSEQGITTLYYLLYARYGNNPIANDDINQFKYKLFAIVYMHGPYWEKEVAIQDRIRNLSEEDIRVGGKMINNRAYNPSSEPSTSALDEIPTINEQTSQNSRKGIIEAYSNLLMLLDEEITERFVARFKICFKQFVLPEHPVLYEDEGDN